MNQHKYLIVGGSTKCGTTSVFNYFENHPQVCPCVMKESRFFWDDIYLLGSRSNKPQTFESLFQNCDESQVRLEATPDYLYSEGSAINIKEHLPFVKIVFILREPSDRLKSWYKFSKLNGVLPSDMSFDNYIQHQIKSIDKNIPQHYRSLEQGKYSNYLKKYIGLFGSENIKIIFYENLSENAGQICAEIASFANIDPVYFKNYDFRIYNQSIPTKSSSIHRLFRKLKRTVRPLIKSLPGSARKRIKLAGQSFEKVYTGMNSSKGDLDMTLEKSTVQFLDQYYSGESDALFQLTGIRTPWQNSELHED